jgi:PAS domain S-box-containing protein
LTGLLLVARQAAVRRELTSLNRALATLAADTRLTELVRQSTDAFLVVDSGGIITFASPASQSVLHLEPQQLQGTSALLLLGAAHEVALGGFLGRLVREPGSPESLEVTVTSHPGAPRMLRISGANQLANPHIEGLALTITDVSALRSLERDVLEIASQERLRLAGDVHEGLGQQLIGIKMMLQGASKAPDADPARQKEYLKKIVDQMGDAIVSVRDLARGLSPMYVVGGSLGGALQRLGKDSSSDTPIHVAVDARFDDRIVGDFPADHLFRIAKEAVQNATRHSGCTQASIDLQLVEDQVVLAVSDNGCGCEFLPHTSNGLGLRMMDYRARVIGGSFSIGRHAAAGTLVQVTVPLRCVVGEAAAG